MQTSTLKSEAYKLGFDSVGVTDATVPALWGERLAHFIRRGHHGDMTWLAERCTLRQSPRALMPDAQSVIVCGLNYAPPENPLTGLHHKSRGLISAYARGKDYHVILKKKLKRLASLIHQQTGSDVKLFVDTAPVMEKPLAQQAGLGWQGKHTNLVARDFGSWLFLGVIYTAARFSPDPPQPDHCGSCRKCQDICPTNAFPAPYQLDARRCIAYLTIEYKGHIAPEWRPAIGNRVFGCDDCLAVCPWNKFARKASETRFAARRWTDLPALADLLTLDEAGFKTLFAGTPVKRARPIGFLRNCLIAAGNSQDRALLPLIQPHLTHNSPIIRAMAVWALGQLAAPHDIASARNKFLPCEPDPDVRAEWQRL